MISLLPGIYGGIISTDSASDFQKLSTIKWHGVSYQDGDESYDFRSFNFKTSNVHAAVALGMLSTIDERILKLKMFTQCMLMGCRVWKISSLPVDVNHGEVPLLIDLVSLNRTSHTQHLTQLGIPTCNYHQSLSKTPGVITVGTTPNSDFFASSVYHPPCGPDRDLFMIEEAISAIRSFG